MKTNRYAWLPLVAAVAGLNGCGSLPSITIDSDPPGAAVRASGREVGQTPVRIVPDDVFPPRFVGGSYRAYGQLEVAKTGCKPYRKEVNDAVLSQDIKVALECDPAAMRDAGQTGVAEPAAVTPVTGTAPAADARAAAIKERLLTLDKLRADGLVTQKEYARIRKRILDGL